MSFHDLCQWIQVDHRMDRSAACQPVRPISGWGVAFGEGSILKFP